MIGREYLSAVSGTSPKKPVWLDLPDCKPDKDADPMLREIDYLAALSLGPLDSMFSTAESEYEHASVIPKGCDFISRRLSIYVAQRPVSHR
jgi:hypothetical protein